MNQSQKNEAKRLISDIRHNTGKFDMLKTSEMIDRLANEFGYDKERIAKECNISMPHIYNMIRLARVPERVKHMIETEQLTSSTVLTLLRKRRTKADIIRLAKEKATEKVVAHKEKEVQAQQQADTNEIVKSMEKNLIASAREKGLKLKEAKAAAHAAIQVFLGATTGQIALSR